MPPNQQLTVNEFNKHYFSGVGLGLPGLKPDLNKADLLSLLSKNDNNLTEKQMLEDKIKFTDWEATNEAIEEHVSIYIFLVKY